MKLSKQEAVEREARKRAYEAQIKESEDQKKLVAKLAFAEKPIGQKMVIYGLRALGVGLSLVLLAALLFGVLS